MAAKSSSPKEASKVSTGTSKMMIDWQEQYKEKVRTPEQAVATIRRGDKVFIGSGAAEPQILVKALIESAGRLADEEMLSDMFYDLSDQTIINRFFSMLKSMPHRKLQQFCCIDYETEMSLVAITKEGVKQKIVGLGSYHLNPATHRAEIAFMVADAWQGKGIGTYMIQSLVKIAKSKNIKGFTAEVLRDNVAMIALMHKAGVEPKSTIVNGSYMFTMDF